MLQKAETRGVILAMRKVNVMGIKCSRIMVEVTRMKRLRNEEENKKSLNGKGIARASTPDSIELARGMNSIKLARGLN